MKGVIIVLVLFCVFPLASAISYYIDEEITLQPTGDARIQGTTNVDFLGDLHPSSEKIQGITSELTTKNGKYWAFTFAPEQSISASNIRISLPKGSVVNYIKSSLPMSISTTNDVMSLSFSGSAQPSISLQYSIELLHDNAVFWAWGFGILSLLLVVALYLKRSRKASKIDLIKPTLNETQIKIIDALLEKKGESSQTALQYLAKIPKASLSRNVEILAQKEIIQKFFNGTSNYVKIHPKMK
jgi:uncharacterized membrane protein